MPFVCHSYLLVCHWHELVHHPFVTRMYSCTICMSLVCTRMPSVWHSYILVYHPYATRMYSYVTCMPLVCPCMSSVYHSSVVLPWAFKPWRNLLYLGKLLTIFAKTFHRRCLIRPSMHGQKQPPELFFKKSCS